MSLTNSELTHIFLALALLLVSAHVFGYLFHRIRMPKVIGEIFGGFLFGNTVLGYFFPAVYQALFAGFPGEGKFISLFSSLGLIFLMFISGFEIQTAFDKQERKTIGALLVGATALPLFAGWLLPKIMDTSGLVGSAQNSLALNIVIALAIAVTSIPVISKIFIDLDIIQTRFAKIVLATATIEDMILWALLAVATGIVGDAQMTTQTILTHVGITIAFFVIALGIVPRLAAWTTASRFNILVKSSRSSYAIIICLLFALLASVLNVNLIFGALLAGILVGRMGKDKFEQVRQTIKQFSLAFFIPIYFAVVGMKLDLIHSFSFWLLIIFLLYATVWKTIGTMLAAKFVKMNWLSSLNLAVAMNTRGGPGIVLATVAYDFGIIHERFFVVLVLIAIITSLVAGSWFRYVLRRGWPLLS